MHLTEEHETPAERRARWTAGWAAWAIVVVLIVSVSGALAGCAADRYLTAEQDAEIRATCEAHGCKVVPSPLWEQIEAWLRSMSGRQGL